MSIILGSCIILLGALSIHFSYSYYLSFGFLYFYLVFTGIFYFLHLLILFLLALTFIIICFLLELSLAPYPQDYSLIFLIWVNICSSYISLVSYRSLKRFFVWSYNLIYGFILYYWVTTGWDYISLHQTASYLLTTCGYYYCPILVTQPVKHMITLFLLPILFIFKISLIAYRFLRRLPVTSLVPSAQHSLLLSLTRSFITTSHLSNHERSVSKWDVDRR